MCSSYSHDSFAKWDSLRTSYHTAHGPCANIRLYPGSAVDIRLSDRANVRGQNVVSMLNCCASVDVTNIQGFSKLLELRAKRCGNVLVDNFAKRLHVSNVLLHERRKTSDLAAEKFCWRAQEKLVAVRRVCLLQANK